MSQDSFCFFLRRQTSSTAQMCAMLLCFLSLIKHTSAANNGAVCLYMPLYLYLCQNDSLSTDPSLAKECGIYSNPKSALLFVASIWYYISELVNLHCSQSCWRRIVSGKYVTYAHIHICTYVPRSQFQISNTSVKESCIHL